MYHCCKLATKYSHFCSIVSDHTVLTLLAVAKELQMQEITRRCEKVLCQRKPSIDLLNIAEEYQLSELKEQCYDGLKYRKIVELERAAGYKILTTENRSAIIERRLQWLEKHQAVEKRSRENSTIILTEMGKVFNDLLVAWNMNSINAEVIRYKVWKRVEHAMKEFQKGDGISNLRAYSDPDGDGKK